MKFSILIPAYNEQDCISGTVSSIIHVLAAADIDYEVLVVNDNSTDDTEQVLQQLASDYPSLRSLNNPLPNGLGRAIRYGLQHFQGDAVIITMADGSDAPEDMVTYCRRLEAGYQCVFGSRFIEGSRRINYPPHKLILNRVANWFIKTLFRLDYNDITNAFKAYRREVIEGIQPILSGEFNITVELPLKAISRGYSYAVVPISWRQRQEGESKLHLKEMGSRYLLTLLYVFLEKQLIREDSRKGASDSLGG